MLSRKQKWRRVICNSSRRRGGSSNLPETKADGGQYGISCVPVLKQPPSSGKTASGEDSDDEVSTRTGAISAWSSFDSVEAAFEEDSVDLDNDYENELATELSTPGISTSPEDCRPLPVDEPRGNIKGVTFEPRVQVYLVTHKSELDNRAKQALWWTGRDAAINKRAWLNHLGQPGCGRQSAGRPLLRPRAPSADLDADDDDVDVLAEVAREGLSGGDSTRDQGGDLVRQEQSQSVGILGCRCQACQTEGDDYEYPAPSPNYVAHRMSPRANGGPGSVAGGSRGGYYRSVGGASAASSRSWPPVERSKRGQNEGGGRRGLDEKGSRSSSPASQSNSPLHDADVDLFSNGYFWNR